MVAGTKEGEVSDHDHVGIADDTRHGLQQGTQQAREGIPPANEQGGEIEPVGSGSNELAPQLETKVKGFIDSLTEDEKLALASNQEDEIVATVMSTWSGMLPDPGSFSQYPDYAQRQMVAWNDARILDESKRHDKITDAAISQANKGQWLSFVLNALFAVLSFAAFIVTGSIVSFGFLAIPGISVVFNIVQNSKDKKESKED